MESLNADCLVESSIRAVVVCQQTKLSAGSLARVFCCVYSPAACMRGELLFISWHVSAFATEHGQLQSSIFLIQGTCPRIRLYCNIRHTCAAKMGRVCLDTIVIL
jgi:hypothetical protein